MWQLWILAWGGNECVAEAVRLGCIIEKRKNTVTGEPKHGARDAVSHASASYPSMFHSGCGGISH